IVFPDKTTHEENYLEFIARDKLRDKLNLNDGDKVTLEIDI
ncbi:MAG: CTP-dependent riboflavin kinase, partial [Methanobrevibacter boviskoreani]